jgi:hypothetical protein
VIDRASARGLPAALAQPLLEKTMKKMFAAVLLLTTSLVACGGKKDNTTPKEPPAMEHKGDATGGAAYGGKKADGAPAPANPADPK